MVTAGLVSASLTWYRATRRDNRKLVVSSCHHFSAGRNKRHRTSALQLTAVPPESGAGRVLMFFHGSAFPAKDSRGGFDNFASSGLAWSDDLVHWRWPKPGSGTP